MSRRLDRAHNRGTRLLLTGKLTQFRVMILGTRLEICLGSAYERAQILSLVLDLDRARTLYRDLDPQDFARTLMSEDTSGADLLDRVRDLVDRAHDLHSTVAQDLFSTRGRHLVHAFRRARTVARAHLLVSALKNVQVLVTTFAAVLDTDEMIGGVGEEGRATELPAGAAVRVVLRMVRVLPAGDRDRYRQEYLAELYILAQEQTSRRAQLGHALRAAARMWSLRRALRASRPGRERSR